MSTAPKDKSTSYSEQLSSLANPRTPPVKKSGENDNEIHRPQEKCFMLSTEHSAVAIGFHFKGEANNCPYMLRRRFRFVKGWIILKFADETLLINGRNLGTLFTNICRHKVEEIFIADYLETEDEDSPYIDYITLKPNSEVNIDELPTKPER